VVNIARMSGFRVVKIVGMILTRQPTVVNMVRIPPMPAGQHAENRWSASREEVVTMRRNIHQIPRKGFLVVAIALSKPCKIGKMT